MIAASAMAASDVGSSRLAAARDGKRILQALEEALKLDPTLDDGYFGMGMYKYYADVAPAAAKIGKAGSRYRPMARKSVELTKGIPITISE